MMIMARDRALSETAAAYIYGKATLHDLMKHIRVEAECLRKREQEPGA